MKYFIFILLASGMAKASSTFPLDGIYTTTKNNCMPMYKNHEQIHIQSDNSGVVVEILTNCTSQVKACDLDKADRQFFGEYGIGIDVDTAGAPGMTVRTGVYGRNNSIFVSFENIANDAVGASPSVGTNLVIYRLATTGHVMMNYRNAFCELQSLTQDSSR